MNPRTIPSRIAIGFLLVVLLLLLVGGIAFWRISGVNSQVASLATNTVPSVVVLGKISQCNAAVSRASRRVLLSDGNALMRASAEAAYSEAKKAGDDACGLYTSSLRSDEEDTRRITAAIEARSDFSKKADTLVQLVKAGLTEDAEKWLIDEVRSLAQRSAAAAKETADKIEAAIANSQRGSRSCSNVGDSLEQIVERVAAADVLVAEIASAAREQSQGIRQVGVAMTQMDKVTQGNAASAEQSSSAAEELTNQAQLLQENVEQLQTLIASTSQSADAAVSYRPARASRPAAQRAAARQAAPSRATVEARRQAPHIVMPDDDPDATNFRSF